MAQRKVNIEAKQEIEVSQNTSSAYRSLRKLDIDYEIK